MQTTLQPDPSGFYREGNSLVAVVGPRREGLVRAALAGRRQLEPKQTPKGPLIGFSGSDATLDSRRVVKGWRLLWVARNGRPEKLSPPVKGWRQVQGGLVVHYQTAAPPASRRNGSSGPRQGGPPVPQPAPRRNGPSGSRQGGPLPAPVPQQRGGGLPSSVAARGGEGQARQPAAVPFFRMGAPPVRKKKTKSKTDKEALMSSLFGLAGATLMLLWWLFVLYLVLCPFMG